MNLKKWKEINLLFSSEGPFPMEGGSKEENEAVSFLQRNVNSFSDFFFPHQYEISTNLRVF